MDKLNRLNKPIYSNKDGAILSKLWRKILIELNLVNSIPYLVNRYIKSSKATATEQRVARTPLLNNIVAEEMTWKVFINLVFNLLRIKSLKVVLILEHSNGKESPPISITVHSNDNGENKEVDDDKENI